MRFVKLAAALAACAVMGALGTPVAVAQSACADLGGEVNAEGTCRVHVQNRTYTLTMTFPDDYPDQQALVAYLTQARDGFVNVAENPDARNLPYELDARGTGYRSGPPNGGTRSVVFTMWENVGGVRPQSYYQAFNWNVAKRAPITFDTLFKPGAQPMPVLYREVNRYLEHQLGTMNPVSEAAGLDPANYQHFALTDDELIFFFSPGQLLPPSAGPVQASVPRSAVASMLAV
jgi:hypothetical protein